MLDSSLLCRMFDLRLVSSTSLLHRPSDSNVCAPIMFHNALCKLITHDWWVLQFTLFLIHVNYYTRYGIKSKGKKVQIFQ